MYNSKNDNILIEEVFQLKTIDTLPKCFLNVAKENKVKTALRHKDFGIWNEITWNNYLEHVKNTFYGLVELGLKAEEKVAILSGNRPEWLYVDIAVQTRRAISVGIFSESTSSEVKYYLIHSEASFIICENQEQVDKVLDVIEQCNSIKKIIVFDLRGMRNYNEKILMSYLDLEKLGEKAKNNNSDLFENNILKTTSYDPALILYTSGTTGNPKGAVITQENIIAAGESLMAVTNISNKDVALSYLPLPWIGERLFSLFLAMKNNYTVNFPESNDMAVIEENMKEICPSLLFAPGRMWENLYTRINIGIDNTTTFKRLVYKLFIRIGGIVAEKKLLKRKIPFLYKLLYDLGEWIVYRPLRYHLGLLYAKLVFTGGAALGPEIFSFFHSIRVPLRQIYGQTETAGAVVMHYPENDIYSETVGKALPGVEIKISEDNEILIKSKSILKEYYNDPEHTKKTLKDGWLYTGDQGYIDENGHLVVIDRQKDIVKTLDGFEFSPQLIENSIKLSRYIKEAIVFGKSKPYLTSLIQIDLNNVGNWAQKNGLPYTTIKDLTKKPEVENLIYSEIQRINKTLIKHCHIKKFVLLEKELDADDGEITRTGKIKRGEIKSKYGYLIEELYKKSAS